MNPSIRQWVVMFGGAGRESCIERMLSEGEDVLAVLVPARRNPKLEQALIRLRSLPVKIVEVEKSALKEELTFFSGKALLSIGFPFLIDGDLLKLFHPALNIHPTLLPRYRGPTTAAYILINNERESGSTIHHMTAEMDRGDIVLQSHVALTAFDTVRSLQRKVYESEPQLLVDALHAIEMGAPNYPQVEAEASEFPKKRTPADSEVDPSLPLESLFNQIRACDPEEFPAFFIYEGEKVCIQLWRPTKEASAFDEI